MIIKVDFKALVFSVLAIILALISYSLLSTGGDKPKVDGENWSSFRHSLHEVVASAPASKREAINAGILGYARSEASLYEFHGLGWEEISRIALLHLEQDIRELNDQLGKIDSKLMDLSQDLDGQRGVLAKISEPIGAMLRNYMSVSRSVSVACEVNASGFGRTIIIRNDSDRRIMIPKGGYYLKSSMLKSSGVLYFDNLSYVIHDIDVPAMSIVRWNVNDCRGVDGLFIDNEFLRSIDAADPLPMSNIERWAGGGIIEKYLWESDAAIRMISEINKLIKEKKSKNDELGSVNLYVGRLRD